MLLYRANIFARGFLPNDPIGSRSARDQTSVNTECTAIIFIRLLLSATYFPEAKLSSTSLSSIFWNIFKDFSSTIWKYSKAFHQHAKMFKDFFACRVVIAANHQYPGNIQRLSRPATSSSKQQQQPAAATSGSNQQQQPAAATSSVNQQQQSTAATSSVSQQQQSAAATSNSDQQQQPAVATSSNNQHSSYQQHLHNQRRLPLVITTIPSCGYPASSWLKTSCPVAECNHRTEAHFCYFSTFVKIPFCDFSPFG